ncbi:sugar phosphate isomerase/epimerase family protein [Modestobacter sp. SSW1-42]|uniref:sugar phosphate isomerase/epimerase family protein n=1 Tax=Modestobacter sp. SSW1-42 TaxID=596372 RepID=UPI0039875275
MSDLQTLPFPFGVNQFTTLPWSFEDDVRNYARLGVDAIELCEVKLDDARRDEQLALLADSGLTVSSVQPKVRTVVASAGQPEPKGREERLADLERSIVQLAPHAPGAAFVTNTGPPPGNGDIAEAIAQTIADHRRLAAVAADCGVRIALEPLSPVSMNQETCIWTFRQALHVVSEVGRDELGICVDLWNLWQDGDLVSDLQSAPDRIFLLQVSDWRTPRSGMDRRSVGTGEIPTGRLLHAVHDAGYRGPCVVEIFSENVPDSLYESDLEALVRDNRDALEHAWTMG